MIGFTVSGHESLASDPSKSPWATTVEELVRIFRDALAAIGPVLERARIHSDDLRAYDDWDQIARTLFDTIVINSVRYSAEAGPAVEFDPYATLVTQPGQRSNVLVRDSSTDQWKVFHSVVSRQRPFDTAKALEANGKTVEEIDFNTAHFAVRIPDRKELVDRLTVEL